MRDLWLGRWVWLRSEPWVVLVLELERCGRIVGVIWSLLDFARECQASLYLSYQCMDW